jgi:hypothetical protein
MKAMLCAALAAVTAVFCACRVLSASETAPATPKNLRIITGPGGSPTLAWDAVPGAKDYKVYCSCCWEAWPLNDKETSSTSIACGGEGYFTVSAVNSGGESPKVEPPVLNGRPAAPRNVRIDNSTSPPLLRWDAVLGAESYTVYRSTTCHPDPFPPAGPIPGFTATEYALPGSGYCYWVAAVATGGASEVGIEDVAHY